MTYQSAVARKERVEPVYMGELVTLNGNDSTLCCCITPRVHVSVDQPRGWIASRLATILRRSGNATHVHENALCNGIMVSSL